MDLNRITLMGHVGQEPAYHKMGNGSELCKFSVATSRRWKDKQTGERREETTWHNVVVFNAYLVTICQNWLQKGTRIYLEGESKTRKYEKDGQTKYITEIIVPQVKGELFVIEKGKGWDVNETPGSERKRSDATQARGAMKSLAERLPAHIQREPGSDDDDDIPF